MRKYFKYAVQLFIIVGVSTAYAGAYEDYFRAIGLDDERTVSSLLVRGFDPNSVDEKGQTGLILALQSQAGKVATVLLAHPSVQVDAINQAGETALMIAALRGDRQWSEELLRRGAQVNRSGWAPLHYAASGPSRPIVELLLARGAALEARSPNGTTPLMMASRYGDEASALLLLERGADSRARNDLGLTAGDFARSADRAALAARLDSAAR